MRLLLTVLMYAITIMYCFAMVQVKSKKPNIIIIMADDLGYDDIGFRGSDFIPTPNIDALMSYGIALNRYYTAPLCTPSRSSLMTGKYPSTVGMQHNVISAEQPYGLGLDEKLLPEYMKEGGYRTHLIGKWHLGFYKKEYLPMQRGFDSHYGYLGPVIDYNNHSYWRMDLPWNFESGFDMRDNMRIAYETKNKIYATDLLTNQAIKIVENHNQTDPMFMFLAHLAPHSANDYEPLQAPQEVMDRFMHITDKKRRTYAAMVSVLDTGIGKLVESLNMRGMLDNTVILFFSDNGAPTIGYLHNTGSNYPLRGQKHAPWDGAVRTTAAIWSASLRQKQRVSHQMIHISDWLPTFANMAGVRVRQPIDGIDVWPALSLATKSPRKDILCNLDMEVPYSSYIRGQWKYINGTRDNGANDGYLWENYTRTERYPGMADYGNTIVQSVVGRALARYSKSTVFGHSFALSALEVELLRAEAQISCGNNPLPTTGSPFSCNPLQGPCLFNIINDPCERINLASIRTTVLKTMETHVKKFISIAMPSRTQPRDARSNPGHFNATWVPWFDELGLPDHPYPVSQINENRPN